MPGLIYDTALASYRRFRKLKNLLLNLIDNPVVVLIYHRVTNLPSDRRLLAVSPNHFRAHMKYLKENFRIVRFEEDWSGLREPAIAITFDDGYADNAVEALPILEDVGVPATFFVSTGTLGTRFEFCWDELERIIMEGTTFPPTFSLEDSRHGRCWSTSTNEQRKAMYDDLLPLLQKLPFTEREAWLEQLRTWSCLPREGREKNRPLSHEELKLLGRSRWATIGAHTVTHTPLSSLTREEQQREIFASREFLKEFLQKEITVFSYPFGGKGDYTETSTQICREVGFKKAASNFPGQARRWTNPYEIPRQLVRNWNLATFATMLRSFWI